MSRALRKGPFVSHCARRSAWAQNAIVVRSAGEPRATPRADSVPSIFTAIQRFGLRLVARKTPVEVLVIDHVEMPSEN
jgi:uncharacterized protein (TIGR03435 family)